MTQPNQDLIDLLLACPYISDKTRRQAVINDLPADIKHNITASTTDKIAVRNLLEACQKHENGLQELLDILEHFEGASSIPLQVVKEFVTKFDSAAPSGIGMGVTNGLAQLPLDHIPHPAPLPPGSRMPFSQNPLFVGREDDLKALAKTLKGGGTAAIGQIQIAAATGLGGIGKTQLASEFVHRYGQYFAAGIYWLSFANPAAIPADIAACAPLTETSLELETQVRRVLAAWQSPLPRLLIFDNCEDETLLNQWRPPSGGSRVLVTSRRSSWDATMGVETLTLGVLTRTESITLLHNHQPDLEQDEAEAIAAELGDLPLALHLAGSFLARYRYAVTATTYLKQLQDQSLLDHASLQGRGTTYSPTGHKLHVARTFALSYEERLDTADETDALAVGPVSPGLMLCVRRTHPPDFAAADNLPG